MKKVISLVLAAAMLLSMAVFVQAEDKDVELRNKICTVKLKEGDIFLPQPQKRRAILL